MKTRKTKLSYTDRTGFVIQKGRMGRSKKYYLGHDKSAAESKAFLIDRIYSIELNEDPKSDGSIIQMRPKQAAEADFLEPVGAGPSSQLLSSNRSIRTSCRDLR